MDRARLTAYRTLLRELLRQFRLEAGIPQEELAQRLGEHQSYVSKYESGGKWLGFIEVWLLCKALGITFDELVRRFQEQAGECDPILDL